MGDGALGIAVLVIMLLGLVLFRLSLQLSESLEHLRATRRILNILGSLEDDLEEVLRILLATASELCRADAAGIVRQQKGGEVLVANLRLPASYVSQLRKMTLLPDDRTLIGRVLAERRTINVLDAFEDSTRDLSTEQRYFRSWIGVPLIMNGQAIGVMVLARTTPSLSEKRQRSGNVTSRLLWSRNMPFSDDEVELVTTFSQHATIAIESSRLFDDSRKQRRQLELANSYKSRFLAAASHDLRQPLHALNLFLAQLQDYRSPQEKERLIANMSESISSMNDLFDALLDMAKLDAGVLSANTEVISFAEVARRLRANFSAAALSKGLELRVASSRVFLKSDLILFERILNNLTANAIQNTTSGGVLIGTRRRGSQIRIDVCDTGPGISLDEHENIFSEFYQIQTTQSRQSNSLGLGLSIVERLARLLGHPLEVKSDLERGTRFSIYVPTAATHMSTSTGQKVRRDDFGVSLQGKRIVIVEDDRMSRQGLASLLQTWGCTVIAAGTEDDAIAQSSHWRYRPDLILCDYHLGGNRSGIEAVDKLRSEWKENTPAFLISGDTSPERIHEATLHNLHIAHKPLTPMKLRAIVNRALRDGRAKQ